MSKINSELVQFLIGKYNIDKYPKKTAEEKYKHSIIENIIANLYKLETMLKNKNSGKK